MKPGDLVRCRSSLAFSYREYSNAQNEASLFNRKINVIWSFATNRNTPPPYTNVVVPPECPMLLLDCDCKEFYDWVKNSRLEDPRNVLSTQLVKLLYDGIVIITFAKWIEPVNNYSNQQKHMNF